MKRTHSLSLANANTSDWIRKNTLDLPKGKGMVGIRLKVTAPIANASGGNAALDAAGKLALLDAFRANLKYGQGREPFSQLSFKTLRTIQRFLFGSEVEGYTDTSTGLGKTIANGVTADLVFYLVVPTGRAWFLGELRNWFAAGRSQAKSMELEIRRGAAPTLTTGFSLSGTVSIEVLPQLVSMKGDRFTYLPEYREFTIRDFRAELPAGLPLLVTERTAAHASSSLTRINMHVDAEEIHRDASPTDIISEINDVPNYPSEAMPSDVATILYAATPDRSLEELPTGRVLVEQPNKDLADFNLGYLWIPVASEEERKADVVEVANTHRMKTIKAVSAAAIEGKSLPSRTAAFVPSVMTDDDDAEHHSFPGLGVPYRGRADDVRVFIPSSVAEAAKGMVAQASANNEPKRAEAIVKTLGAAVPGAASSARGFVSGSILGALRNAVK